MVGKRVHLVIKGRVQGVCFRAFTESMAKSLNLTGWVRNMADGSVEILAEGKENNLMVFKEQVKKGPPAAIVKEVLENWEAPTGEFSDFDIVYWGSSY